MNDVGNYALLLAWILSLVGVIGGAVAGVRSSQPWFFCARNATIGVFLTSGLSLMVLGALFLSDDYTNQYVWQFSNREMSAIYKVSAIWGGMDGSMLLWAAMLSVSTALVALSSHRGPRQLMPWVLSALNSTTLFFLTIVAFVTNPFRSIKAPFIPPDGNGLNPLLQNPLMAIHPPMLYAGFTTFAIPFAFCLGALLSGQLSNEWLRLTRRWTLIAWGFLTCGIVLGGHWAYVELGWGGFWAWDPVENASFLPWLTGSAYLHSVMVQERKNMLKIWNVWLIILTYGLTVFGTFLTRSGIVQSVHAFASTDVGWVFLLYLGLLFALCLGLTIYRRHELRSERKIDSFLSREAAFLVNNLIFLAIAFATLWGVMFPVLSEAITGKKQTVGIPFFNAVNIPLFLFLIFLMGVGPLIAWRKANLKSLSRIALVPGVTAVLFGVLLIWLGVPGFYPILSYSLCWFVTGTLLGELYRGLRAQRVSSTSQSSVIQGVTTLLRRHRARYAGYLIHFGVVIVTVAITASMAAKVEREFTLSVGQRFEVGNFSLELSSLKSAPKKNYDSFFAEMNVYSSRDGSLLTVMKPELRHYKRNDETTTEVALRTTLREDLYLVLAGIEQDGSKASFKVFINPLQVWLWFGTVVMLVGTAIIVVPLGRSVRAVADLRMPNQVVQE